MLINYGLIWRVLVEGLASSLTVAPVGRFGITVTILAGAGTVGASLGPLFDAFFNLSISTMASCSLGVFPAQIFQVVFHFVPHLGLHRLELHFFKVRRLSTFFSGFSRVVASELPGSVFLLGCEAMAPAVAPTARDRRGIAHCFLIRGPT